MAGALAPVLGKHPSLVLPFWLGELDPSRSSCPVK